MWKHCFIILLLLFIAFPAFAWRGRVVSVATGDTLSVQPIEGGKLVQITLWGIQCPKLSQPSGRSARFFLNSLCLFKVVDVDEKAGSDPNSLLAIVYLDDGTALQKQMLTNGFAWIYDEDCRGCYGWKIAEREARRSNRGIWKQNNPIPPWEWEDPNESSGE